MFRNILVPLDGSALADYALPYAARLARRTDATLHLARVVEPPIMWQGPGMEGTYMAATRRDEVMTTLIDQATTHLQAAADRLARTGIRLETARLEGLTTAALLDYERSASIDLVTMCGKGRTGLPRLLFGSVADRLLREGNAPVLRVRPFRSTAVLPQALIPLDGSVRAETALDVVEQLVRRQVVREVRLLRVIGAAMEGPEAERYLEALGQRLERQAIPCRFHVVMGDVARSIREQAGTDTLVVMAGRGRHRLVRLARGSVTDRVTRGNVAAVLLVRETPRIRANLSILPIHAKPAGVGDRALTRMIGS